eukprot:scaffold3953_cov146-Skeletonema_menzelii.AAC.3
MLVPMFAIHYPLNSFTSYAALFPTAIHSTNDDAIPDGWKNGCPHYNGQLFFQSYDECCEKYFKAVPKEQCLKSDINDATVTSVTTAAANSCDPWHPSITDQKTW